MMRGSMFLFLDGDRRQCSRCGLIMDYTKIFDHSIRDCVNELVKQGKLIRG